jgi:restriction system protein
VREFYGVMAARGAFGGYFVTSGEYTSDAKEFVQGRNLLLIDGLKLRDMIDTARSKATNPLLSVTPPKITNPTICPRCGEEMKRRVARQGINAGNEFWGCSMYQKCKGVLSLEESSYNHKV